MSTEVVTEILPGGDKWSGLLRRGWALTLQDVSGRAAVAALFYHAEQPLERYNMPDTLKAQFTSYLTAGRVLFSDMGRVLASITSDSCGWHDTISGHLDAAGSRERFGEGSYQQLRNGFHRNSRDNLLIELGKHGLGLRDLHANVNFFVKVGVDAAGAMRWVDGNSHPGAEVELRAEMDLLVVLSNTPHPLDPGTVYAPPAVRMTMRPVPPPAADDPCRVHRPENARGFILSERYRC